MQVGWVHPRKMSMGCSTLNHFCSRPDPMSHCNNPHNKFLLIASVSGYPHWLLNGKNKDIAARHTDCGIHCLGAQESSLGEPSCWQITQDSMERLTAGQFVH